MKSVRHGPARLAPLPVLLIAAASFWLSPGCGLPVAGSGEEAVGPPRGDVNRDGLVDEVDLDLVIEAFGLSADDPLFVPEADLNADGVVGLDDLQALVSILNAQESAAGN